MAISTDGAAAPPRSGAVGYRRAREPGADRLILSPSPLSAIGGFVLVLAGALALREAASLMLPIVVGLLIALVAWPMVGALERRGARHGFALAATIAIVLAVVLLAAAITVFTVGELVVLSPRYESRLNAAAANVRDQLVLLGIFADPGAIAAIISPERIVAIVQPVASAVYEAGGAMIVVVFTLMYALAGGTSFQARATAAFGEHSSALRGIERYARDVQRYLVVRTQLGLFAAVLSAVLLLALGVPLPVLWAVLVFVASFIPNVGALIAVIPPAILAYLDGGLAVAVMVIVGYGVINFAQDQFLQPVVMGSQLNLSPLVVLIGVIVWAWILGPAGALLAVPLTIGLVMALEAFPSSRGLASLLRNTVETHPGNPA